MKRQVLPKEDSELNKRSEERNRKRIPFRTVYQFTKLFLIVAVILVIIAIIYRPPVLWEPLKSLLNISISVNTEQIDLNATEIALDIYPMVIEESRLELSEAQVAGIIQDRLSKDTVVNIENKEVFTFINLEGEETSPLWFMIKTEMDTEGIPKITQSGFGIVKMPGFINEAFSKGLLYFLGLEDPLAQQREENIVVDWIAGNSRDFNIENIVIEEEKVVIKLNIEYNLLDFIP